MMSDGYTNPLSLPPTPDGWNVVAIEDICQNVTSGGTPLRSNQSFYEGGIYSWFKTQELKDSILYESEEKITDKALEQSSAKLFPKGTVLMAMYGDGKTITSLGILSKEAATNQACCAMIPNPNLCDSRFLFYALKYHRDDFIQIASGGAQRNLSGKLIRRFALNTPPLPEQRAIAHILGTLDDKIELNRRMNETLESMARAIFKSWFVDFDPVRAKAEGRDTGLPEEIADLFPDSFEETELGEVPKGWKIKGLDEIAEYLNGLALQKYPPEEGKDTLPRIKIAQLKVGNTEGAEISTSEIPAEYIVKDGDVLFSWSGSLEVEIWCGGLGALNQHLFKVTSKEYPKWFYYLWTKYHLPAFRDIAAHKATTMGHIQRKHLSEAKVLDSNSDLLKKIDECMEPLIERIIANNIESRNLAELRDTLLPRLISGELRVKEAEHAI